MGLSPVIPADDLCRRLREILAELRQPLFVSQEGEVKAVLVDVESYNRIVDEIEDVELAADPQVRAAVAAARRTAPGDWVSIEDHILQE